MTPRFRDLLALEPLSADELTFLLDQSKSFQEIQRHPLKKLATLRGKTVALAFFENSTRTRISFGTAASRLGADTMNLQAEASSLKKGESLLDTVHTLDAMKPAPNQPSPSTTRPFSLIRTGASGIGEVSQANAGALKTHSRTVTHARVLVPWR